MPANSRCCRSILATDGLLLFAGWLTTEFTLAAPTLSSLELIQVVGGVSGCELFSEEKPGYRCSSQRTMSCTLICSPCGGYSNNEILCRLKKCWGCTAGGTHPQLKECIVGTEEEQCSTFGDQPEQVTCGNEESRNCLFDTVEQRCYCDPPLFDSGFQCARKDCLSL